MNTITSLTYLPVFTDVVDPLNIATSYNDIVLKKIKNPTKLSNTAASSNVIRSFNIVDRGWNINLQCNSEGQVGFTPNNETRPRRDSGYVYSKSLYTNNLEPYYQFICKFNLTTQITFVHINYDENILLGSVNITTGGSITYGFIFEIIKNGDDYILGPILFRNSTTFTNNKFEIGIKHYNREDIKWAPNIINTTYISYNIEYFNPINTTLSVRKYDGTLYSNDTELPNYKLSIKNNYYSTKKENSWYTPDINNLIIKNAHSITENSESYVMDNILNNYSFSFFREGIETDILLKVKTIKSDTEFSVILKNNNIYNTSQTMIFSDYIIYDNNNYTKKIKINDKPMVPGFISGTIILPNCNVESKNLMIYCYRSDGQYIGEYKIINSGYEIPNLNINDTYNIILADYTRTIEWKISSHRKPAPYKKYIPIVAYAVTDINLYRYNNRFILQWSLDMTKINTNIERIKLYFSNEFIDDINISKTSFIYVTGITCDLSYYFINNYNFYLIETIYKDTYNRSSCIKNNIEQKIIKLKGEFNGTY